ncbi:hypothetical protein CHL78_015490 [Romboutsia weinsteinii]|uniref:Uncharacterized protein n=1 Tax=Romboutsia weinsteinii TaxID=2020949 RepID=A0A371IZV0_9FIRM|nr:permease prefix domain 1-containing protein [Romboutsia weinsteinii]RDY25983.1 hypothetical protein CHL78_015490 [Romboutsia weinsteinii]
MNHKIEKYVSNLFENAPKTKKNYELKEEITSNVNDKYYDLLESGMDENEAYNKAISNIGDVEELISYDFMKQDDEVQRKRSAKITAIAVMMYIICPVPVILFESFGAGGERIGITVMFLLIAAATGLLIYNGVSRPQYQKMDDTMVEEFKEWKSANDQNYRARKSVTSAMWTIITVIYFLVSFMFGNWGTSWIIFVIGGAIEQIIKAYYDLKGDK